MKKQLQTFLMHDDEDALSRELRAARPSIRFVDDSVWPSASPPTHDSIVECVSPWAFIWDAELFPQLPSRQRPDGRFDGPSSGVVLQVCRSRLEDTILWSGRFAIGCDEPDEEHRRLVALVFTTLEKITVPAVWTSTEKKAPEYRVGYTTCAWRQIQGHTFCDRATRQILTCRVSNQAVQGTGASRFAQNANQSSPADSRS